MTEQEIKQIKGQLKTFKKQQDFRESQLDKRAGELAKREAEVEKIARSNGPVKSATLKQTPEQKAFYKNGITFFRSGTVVCGLFVITWLYLTYHFLALRY